MTGPIQHGGGLAAAARLYGGRIEGWLDLSTGINPCPPCLPTIDPRAWHRLPDREREEEARLAARDFYGSGTRLPLPVPGTQAAIQLLPKLIDPSAQGRMSTRPRAAILSPTYGEYARSLAASGIAVDAVGSLDKIDERYSLAVIVNPNNPTGRVFEAEELLALARRMAAHGGLLVVDEAFADAEAAQSLAGAVEHEENLVVFRSFGKFFGMAGLRLGFVIANPAIEAKLVEGLGPWAVSGPALAVATGLFRANRSAIVASILERRAALQAILDQHDLKVIGGTALFALVEHEKAAALHAHLCRAHILTRIFDYAPGWMRFGLAPDAEADERLRAALSSFTGAGA
ncbi:threonine-phosphate decarboxylase CobD [Rhizobium paknamense]|uniref:threonine-phosphate decarboxylase n=1 Tax=Rhizobium paknamense TaxID=1206817 RepID=A0ABU0ICN1_9HYPH|nr:threonine-phosphate decarboxylase CobD [Rhizobium paknamense]MDQ0455951.1 cobalamin biosynthetic protein CobC [Rhizobium paknamense]